MGVGEGVRGYDPEVEYIALVFGSPFRCAVCGRRHVPSKNAWLRCYAKAHKLVRKAFHFSCKSRAVLRQLHQIHYAFASSVSKFPVSFLVAPIDFYLKYLSTIRLSIADVLLKGISPVIRVFKRYVKTRVPVIGDLLSNPKKMVTMLDYCLKVAERCEEVSRAEIEVAEDAVRKLPPVHLEYAKRGWDGHIDYLYVSSGNRYRYDLAIMYLFGHRVDREFFFKPLPRYSDIYPLARFIVDYDNPIDDPPHLHIPSIYSVIRYLRRHLENGLFMPRRAGTRVVESKLCGVLSDLSCALVERVTFLPASGFKREFFLVPRGGTPVRLNLSPREAMSTPLEQLAERSLKNGGRCTN